MSKATEREAVIVCLASLLKEERLRLGLSLNEASVRSGLSRAMIMRVEKRERLPSIETLLRITEALGVRLSLLIARAEKDCVLATKKE